jgi:hypothetical protein
MSIGKINSYVDKNSNFPWQFKMLQGLQGVIDALGGSGIGQTRSAVAERINATFSIPTIVYSFSVANVGTADGVIQGQTIKPGEIMNFDAGGMNNYFPINSVSGDGTGTELLITWITA